MGWAGTLWRYPTRPPRSDRTCLRHRKGLTRGAVDYIKRVPGIMLCCDSSGRWYREYDTYVSMPIVPDYSIAVSCLNYNIAGNEDGCAIGRGEILVIYTRWQVLLHSFQCQTSGYPIRVRICIKYLSPFFCYSYTTISLCTGSNIWSCYVVLLTGIVETLKVLRNNSMIQTYIWQFFFVFERWLVGKLLLGRALGHPILHTICLSIYLFVHLCDCMVWKRVGIINIGILRYIWGSGVISSTPVCASFLFKTSPPDVIAPRPMLWIFPSSNRPRPIDSPLNFFLATGRQQNKIFQLPPHEYSSTGVVQRSCVTRMSRL